MAITSFSQVNPLGGNDVEIQTAQLMESMMGMHPNLRRQFMATLMSGAAAVGAPMNGLEAIAMSQDRPVDEILMGDSINNFGGDGWDDGLGYNYEIKSGVGIWASALGPFTPGSGGTQYSQQGANDGGAGFLSGGVQGLPVPAFFEDRQLPDASLLNITADIAGGGGLSGMTARGTSVTPMGWSASSLKYHIYHGTSDTGNATFTPAVRIESPSAVVKVGNPVAINTGVIGEAEATLQLDADPTRTATLGFRPRQIGGTTSIAPFVLLAQRLQNLDREVGMSVHSDYGIGGQSLYDMAQFVSTKGSPLVFTGALVGATAGNLNTPWLGGSSNSYRGRFSDGSLRTITLTQGSTAATWTGDPVTAGSVAEVTLATNIPSLRRLSWVYGKLRAMQILRGFRPIIVRRISSGANDRNEGFSSRGWRGVSPGSSPKAYLDNLEYIVAQNEEIYRLAGGLPGELFFKIVPTYPLADDSLMVQYRAIAADFCARRANCSFVDYSLGFSYADIFSNNWLADGLHPTQAGVRALTKFEIDIVPWRK